MKTLLKLLLISILLILLSCSKDKEEQSCEYISNLGGSGGIICIASCNLYINSNDTLIRVVIAGQNGTADDMFRDGFSFSSKLLPKSRNGNSITLQKNYALNIDNYNNGPNDEEDFGTMKLTFKNTGPFSRGDKVLAKVEITTNNNGFCNSFSKDEFKIN